MRVRFRPIRVAREFMRLVGRQQFANRTGHRFVSLS
jgi:hypothetical protein